MEILYSSDRTAKSPEDARFLQLKRVLIIWLRGESYGNDGFTRTALSQPATLKGGFWIA